jgi:hypothetical protein
MKKPVKVAAVILGVGVAFVLGTQGKTIITNASLDWSSNAQNRAYNELLSTKNQVASDLLTDTSTDITNTLSSEVDSQVDTNADELRRLMDEYYRLRLEGLSDTPQFRELEQKINQIMMSLYGSFKTEVDNAFKDVGF